MTTANPSSLTVEEAVARMINMDYIPSGFTLLQMTAAFQEEAEVELENAQRGHVSDDPIEALQLRLDACAARHTLAHSLLDRLRFEIANPQGSMIVQSDDRSSVARLTLSSVSSWASDRYGIGIAEWPDLPQSTIEQEEPTPRATWEQVKVKIYKDYKIGWSVEKGNFKTSSFVDIGLMGTRKIEPNFLGGILIGLSNGKKYPSEGRAESKHATAISKLRGALKRLTGIESDPFLPTNEADGWKPRFELIDDRQNADKRAKEKAIHVPLEDTDGATGVTDDFEREDDQAQDFLDKAS